MRNMTSNRIDRDDDIRIRLRVDRCYDLDNELVTLCVGACLETKRKQLLITSAGLAQPNGEVILLQRAHAYDGLISSCPEFPFWLTPVHSCRIQLDYPSLSRALADRHNDTIARLTALFTTVAGETYYSEPLDFDCAAVYHGRASEEEMKFARDMIKKCPPGV